MSDSNEDRKDIELALDDLFSMEIICPSSHYKQILFSPSFFKIFMNVMSESEDISDEDIRKNLYFSILIYMNQHLKFPKSFTIALGNDLEKDFQGTECGRLMLRYINVLANIYFQHERDKKY